MQVLWSAGPAEFNCSTVFVAHDEGLEALGADAAAITGARQLGATAAASVLNSRSRPLQRFR